VKFLTGGEPGGLKPTSDDAARRTLRTLHDRPARPEDYKSESQALWTLAHELVDRPYQVQQRLAELVLDLCRAGSAGVSVLVNDGGVDLFKWSAVAGAFGHHLGGTMPRNESPCGIVVDLDHCLLYENLAEDFPATSSLRPEITEIILAPFHVNGRPVGTIWALCHDPQRRFDAEDMRLLTSVASFASLKIFSPQPPPSLPSVRADAARADMASLTGRQMEILERILHGQPNKNIAADLGISQRTAENHRAAIMRKMHVSSISALVQSALLGFEPGRNLGESERNYAGNDALGTVSIVL